MMEPYPIAGCWNVFQPTKFIDQDSIFEDSCVHVVVAGTFILHRLLLLA